MLTRVGFRGGSDLVNNSRGASIQIKLVLNDRLSFGCAGCCLVAHRDRIYKMRD